MTNLEMEEMMDKNEEQIPNPPLGFPPANQYYPPEDEISLVDLWLVLVKRKKIILLLPLLPSLARLYMRFRPRRLRPVILYKRLM